MCRVAALLCVLGLALVVDPTLCRVLNDFIRHYEPLHYNEGELMWNHHRIKRSLVGPKEVELHFQAFGRSFDLVLEPERKLFDPNFTLIKNGKKQTRHDTFTYIYSGYDVGDRTSRVYGNLAHGVFDGTVETVDEMYHVEPASRYLAHLNNSDTDSDKFHSIIYRQSDLDTSSITGATCGSTHDDVQSSMLRLQQGSMRGRGLEGDHVLMKRQMFDPRRTRCPLSVRLDYRLFRELDNNGENPMAVVLNIILRGSSIFADTDFNGDDNADGVNFSIRELIVEETPPQMGTFFANDFIGVSAFLNEHSQENYTDFCLAYRFTYRDFDGGVVGLAYIGPQPGENLRGGICDRESGGRTLNTGIVTSLNFGRRIPPSLSGLTFAHEAGHNFGSQHDTDDPPSGGAYLMHAFATDGSRPNNDAFSPASRGMMGPVIINTGQGADGCFVEEGDNCGNMLLDPGEECDCGSASNILDSGVCRNNSCCFGRNCTLNSNVQCSPDQGPCCGENDCMFIPASANRKCSPQTDCALNQTCGGFSAQCPDPVARVIPPGEEFLSCEDGTGFCNGATCNGTLCSILNPPLEECECSLLSQACHVCCVVDSTCTSTFDIAERDLNALRSMLPNMTGGNRTIGTPCANFTGYCDALNNCLAVDENGALFRLANLFFDSEALRKFLDFAQEMWWVLVIVFIAVLVGLFLLVMLFHCILPRPKTVQSRNRRKNTLRTSQAQQVRIPPGNYPQNYPQYNQHT